MNLTNIYNQVEKICDPMLAKFSGPDQPITCHKIYTVAKVVFMGFLYSAAFANNPLPVLLTTTFTLVYHVEIDKFLRDIIWAEVKSHNRLVAGAIYGWMFYLSPHVTLLATGIAYSAYATIQYKQYRLLTLQEKKAETN